MKCNKLLINNIFHAYVIFTIDKKFYDIKNLVKSILFVVGAVIFSYIKKTITFCTRYAAD